MKKKKIKKRTIILIGIFAFVIIMIIAFSIIFCYKGDYPKEMFMATVPIIFQEIRILFELKKYEIEEEKNDS